MRHYKKFTIHQFDEIDSTNSHAFNLTKNRTYFDREVVTSDQQISGRGRLDRKWESGLGNLFCSIILKPQTLKIPFQSAHKLSFLTIIALKNAILSIDRKMSKKVQLKWPNDLLVNGKKISGILLESSNKDGFVDFAIIGIGVNITNYPQNVLFDATSLKNEGIEIDKNDFLEILLDEFETLYKLIERFGINETFLNIRKLWLKDAYKLNAEVEVNLGDKKVVGIFDDIDEEGSLVLLSKNEKIKINFGDIGSVHNSVSNSILG